MLKSLITKLKITTIQTHEGILFMNYEHRQCDKTFERNIPKLN